MITLLAARPFRRRNFACIEIGQHLIREGDTYWIRFDGPETKTGEPIDTPLPAGVWALAGAISIGIPTTSFAA